MKEHDHSRITQILTLLVFGIFALSVTAVLLTGAGAYRKLTERDTAAHESRVAVRYLTTRFHQAPSVGTEDFQGVQALTIREEIGGRTYLTWVYCYEGFIRELFSAESANVALEDGEKILEAEALTFARADSLLTVCCTDGDGNMQQVLLHCPDWKEALP